MFGEKNSRGDSIRLWKWREHGMDDSADATHDHCFAISVLLIEIMCPIALDNRHNFYIFMDEFFSGLIREKYSPSIDRLSGHLNPINRTEMAEQ